MRCSHPEVKKAEEVTIQDFFGVLVEKGLEPATWRGPEPFFEEAR
jgi:hypothetical protein